MMNTQDEAYNKLLEHEGQRIREKRDELDRIEAVLTRAGFSLAEWAQFLNWRDGKNSDNGHHAGIELVQLASIASVPLRWLWPGKIPAGKLTLLVGDPGLGKSVITLDLAAQVTIGAAWPDGGSNAAPGDVIVLSAEDDPADTMRPRLEVAGADLDRVFILKGIRRQDGSANTFSLVEDLQALRDCLGQFGGSVRLIIIDPISAYLGDTDSHINTEVRAVMAPLAELAASSGVATLGVSHLNKGQGVAIYRVQGSIAFVASARAVWAVGKDPKDETGRQRLLLPVKMNLASDVGGIAYALDDCGGNAAVHWGEQVSADASEVMGPTEEAGAREEASQWLDDFLFDGPVPAKTVHKEARSNGIAERTLWRAKKSLGVIAKKGLGPRSTWEWRLPGDNQECQDYHPDNVGTLGSLTQKELKGGG